MGLIEQLSAAFVAFVIEVDDTLETRRPVGKGPWLSSVVMWRNCMQWLPADGNGITVAELAAVARTPTDLHGMRRWGYVEVEGWARPSSGPPRQGAVVRPTGRGAQVAAVWDGLPADVEQVWTRRYRAASDRDAATADGDRGAEAGTGDAERPDASPVAELRAALVDLVRTLDPGLPDTMPIIRHGWATRRDEEPDRRPGLVSIAELGLDSLLARTLTAFALEFEASGKLSLALCANLFPVLGPEPIPLRDLPDATGIQREQTDNVAGYFERGGIGKLGPIPGTKRGKALTLTERGAKAKSANAVKLANLEATWDERHGPVLSRLREALVSLDLTIPDHPPGTWRAEAKPLARLPRFPLVTHRGGFPDGA